MQGVDVALSQEQKDRFTAYGFLSLERVTTPEEVADFVPIYDEMFLDWRSKPDFTPRDLAGKKGNEGEDKVIQMHDMSMFAPRFALSTMRANAISVAAQLLGPRCLFRTDHAICKPVGSDVDTPWHQDQWYWNPKEEFRRVSVWIPLQDVDEQNGCMQFVSRQRIPDTIAHRRPDMDPESNAWEADPALFDPDERTSCPLPAGGATVHYGKTLHFTSGNRSNQPRRAYIVSCGDPATELWRKKTTKQ